MDESSNDIDQLFRQAAQHAAGLAYVLDPAKAIERGTLRRRFARRRRIALSGLVVLVAVVVFLVPLPQLHLFGSGPLRPTPGSRPPTTVIGPPVPATFQPSSASFLSSASGFVLGGVDCPSLPTLRPCAARLVATTDGGVHWHFVSAPVVRLFNGAGVLSAQRSTVSSVVFASSRDVWLFGPGLWSTHDGGAHWRKLSLGGAIVGMAASSGVAYAVVAPSTHLSADYGSEQLFRSPVGRDAWARVGRVTAAGATLAVSGRAAWFGSSTQLWTTADGVHWHQYPFRCPGAYYSLSSIAAANASDVLFLCAGNGAMGSMDKEVVSSANGGRTVHLAGQAPLGGTTEVIAVPPSRSNVVTLATTSDASWLDRSADGGKTWVVEEVKGSGGGAPLNSLSYVSATVGWVVLGQPGLGSDSWLLRTSDAGVTWNKVGF
jgi:hypothetical protein